MAPTKNSLRVSVDTNVIIDRAEQRDFAIDVLELLREEKISVVVTDTVLEELGAIGLPPHPIAFQDPRVIAKAKRKSKLALLAMDNLQSWGVDICPLDDVQRVGARKATQALSHSGLLPPEERQDAGILVEAAIVKATFLITSDNHLLAITRMHTLRFLEKHALDPVEIVSPRLFYIRIKEFLRPLPRRRH